MNRVTLRHYKIFLAVCEYMNMTVAAENLFLSQSAVSQAIAEMEKHYGVRLFERMSRKLFLTTAGKKLLRYANQIVRMDMEAEDNMKALQKDGSIRVGASVTIGAYILPKLVSHFQQNRPGTDVFVVEDNTANIEAMLLGGQLDLALVEGDTASSDLITLPFLSDELVLICGPGHPFAGRKQIEPQEMEQETFIIREKGSGTRKTFEDEMAAKSLTWREGWICNNADTIKLAVQEGLGVSVISRLAVKEECKMGKLCAVEVRGMQFRRLFKAVYHKGKYLTDAMTEMIDICKEEQSYLKLQ